MIEEYRHLHVIAGELRAAKHEALECLKSARKAQLDLQDARDRLGEADAKVTELGAELLACGGITPRDEEEQMERLRLSVR